MVVELEARETLGAFSFSRSTVSDRAHHSPGGRKQMTRYIAAALTCFLTIPAAKTAVSQERSSTAAIENAVKLCVADVHGTGAYYEHFDAYYNPATKSVENNVVYVGQQGALYLFRKCMASQGLPLK